MADQPPNNPPEENEPESGFGSFEGFSQEDIDAALAAAGGDDAAPASDPAPAGDAGELSQADIDAAMAAAGGDAPTEDAGSAGEMSQADIDAAMAGDMSQADIDAAMAAGTADAAETSDAAHELTNPDGTPKLDTQGRPFDEAAAMMAAAIEEEKAAAAAASAAPAPAPAAAAPPPQVAHAEPAPLPPPPAGSVPLDIPDFGGDFDPQDAKGIGLLNDVQLDVRIELGRSDLYIEDVLKLGKGAVVELDRLAGDPVDVIVNDRLVARGEVLVLNDNFCVRISEILVGKDDG